MQASKPSKPAPAPAQQPKARGLKGPQEKPAPAQQVQQPAAPRRKSKSSAKARLFASDAPDAKPGAKTDKQKPRKARGKEGGAAAAKPAAPARKPRRVPVDSVELDGQLFRVGDSAYVVLDAGALQGLRLVGGIVRRELAVGARLAAETCLLALD